MKRKFEYVPSSEYDPVIRRIRSCMDRVSHLVYEKGLSFDWGFVGSTNRNGHLFITREIGGNKGFDHDVNIYLKRPSDDEHWKADFARLTFYEAIDKVFHDLGYKHAEDRTSVIRVKFPDVNNRTIMHSCDFAVFQDIRNGDGTLSEKYARKYDNGSYGWTTRGGRNDDAIAKLQWLEGHVGDDGDNRYPYCYKTGSLYGNLKGEYINLKNSNQDDRKCSFQLFNEAINNVFNQWQQFIRDEKTRNE